MTDDRTLLEMAARAAGYRVHGWIDGRLYVVDLDPLAPADPFHWQPDEEDGDALRLAVKLSLYIGASAHCPTQRFAGRGDLECDHYDSNRDQCAATRRAIVRAAAAIGSAM